MKFNQNLRILIKERNKVNFKANALASILEFNLSHKTPILAYLIKKNIQNFTE